MVQVGLRVLTLIAVKKGLLSLFCVCSVSGTDFVDVLLKSSVISQRNDYKRFC